MGRIKTLAEQIADLGDQNPQDFDPEEERDSHGNEDSGSDESNNGLAGTEHYAQVGESKLRKPEELNLGAEYSGSKVSRSALLDGDEDEDISQGTQSRDDENSEDFADSEKADLDADKEDGDIDKNNALGESNVNKSKNLRFRCSWNPRTPSDSKQGLITSDFMSESEDLTDEENEGVVMQGNSSSELNAGVDTSESGGQHYEALEAVDDEPKVLDKKKNLAQDNNYSNHENGETEDESETTSQDEGEDEEAERARRAELRNIMEEEQKTVMATISQAAKADAVKGAAVKAQRKAFDSLLSVRMVLQKALIANNSMAVIPEKNTPQPKNEPYEAAEEAAIKLWNTLDQIRQDLSKSVSNASPAQKRKRDIDISTSSWTIWERMQNSEVALIDHRQKTLEKWSAKVRGPTAIPLARKLNPTAPQQSIIAMLQDQLAGSEHLVRRTKMPRSCAPAQRDLKIVEDPEIYDDGNFYQLLLTELVDQRRAESLFGPAHGAGDWHIVQRATMKEAKTRNVVDTKASKGRKMRFTVHEKLQNFMAPEDRTTWDQTAIDRLFGTLLGRTRFLVEDERGEEGEGENVDFDAAKVEEEGLKLFRS